MNSADHKTRLLTSLNIIHAECVKIDIELDLQRITVSFTLQCKEGRVFKDQRYHHKCLCVVPCPGFLRPIGRDSRFCHELNFEPDKCSG